MSVLSIVRESVRLSTSRIRAMCALVGLGVLAFLVSGWLLLLGEDPLDPIGATSGSRAERPGLLAGPVADARRPARALPGATESVQLLSGEEDEPGAGRSSQKKNAKTSARTAAAATHIARDVLSSLTRSAGVLAGQGSETARGRIRGWVRDARGTPVPGAVVQLSQLDVQSERRRWPAGLRLPQQVLSDVHGRFQFERLPALPYQLTVRRLGFASRYLASVPAGSGRLEVSLSREHRIEGRVLDPRGRPLAGASVLALFEMDGAPPYRAYARSGPDGAYAVGVEPGMLVRLEAKLRGYGVARRRNVPEGARGIDLRLRPLRSTWVHGRVVSRRSGEALPAFRINGQQVRDPAGRFRVRVYADRPELRITARGFQPRRQKVTLRAAPRALGRLALAPWRHLSGRVLVGDQVVPGAEVTFRGEGLRRRVRADRHGRYLLTRLPPGPARIVARAPGLVEAKQRVTLPLPGESERIDLHMQQGHHTVRVRVLDGQSGRPVVGAWVDAEGRSQGRTDGEGRLAARGITRSPVRLTISHSEYHAFVSGALTPDTEQEIRLERLSGISGLVTCAGKPVPPRVLVRLWAKGARTVWTVRTEAEGRYRLLGVPAGVYFLQVPEYRTLPRPVTIGSRPLHHDVVTAGAATVRGVVRDHEGLPAANLTVRLLSAAHGYAWDGPPARTDAEGRYQLDHVPPGRHVLTVHKNARDSRRARLRYAVDVTGGVATRDVVLPRLRNAVRGVVRDARGKPLVSVAVLATYLGRGEHRELLSGWTTSDARGRFSLLSLRDGPHRVRAAGGFAPLLDLQAGQAPTVTLRAPRGRWVRGSVRNEDGSPSCLTRVVAIDAQGRRAGPFAGTPSWRPASPFAVGPLPPGRHVLELSARGCTLLRVPVEVADKDLSLRLSMSRHE